MAASRMRRPKLVNSSPDGFRAGRDEVNDNLSQINSRLPAALDLVSLTDDTKTLTVNGLADDEEAVFGYAQDLRASGRFSLTVTTDMQTGTSGQASP